MTLPSAPPKFGTWAELVSPIIEGETGWRVFALQRALTVLGRELMADGIFGTDTRRKLLNFQAAEDLTADGIAGGATQARMLKRLGALVHDSRPGVPDGLMRGFAEGEGANVLAATNWSVAGGVDCGTMQYRVYGPPYSLAALSRAFDAIDSMVRAGDEFLVRTSMLCTGAWILGKPATRRAELSKRCAIMAHNWPAGARSIADHGTCSSPDAIASWVGPNVKFPDGTPVRTRWEWCQFYAMGGTHGEAAIPKYVTSWS